MDMTEVAQLREDVFQVAYKLDRAIELLNTLTQQHQKLRATPMENGNAPESALSPHKQATSTATADETPPDQQEQETVEN